MKRDLCSGSRCGNCRNGRWARRKLILLFPIIPNACSGKFGLPDSASLTASAGWGPVVIADRAEDS